MSLRFFIRSSLLVCLSLMLLIGAVLIGSGALRPVRYFVAESRGDILLVAADGDTVQVTMPRENFRAVRTGESQIAWFNDDGDVVVWSDGKRQQIGRYLLNNSVLQAGESPGNYVAWQPELTSELMVWDGEAVYDVSAGSGPVILWNWMNKTGLVWVQAGADQEWQLMHWDGQEIKQLYSSENQLAAFNFLSCGAVHLDFMESNWIYNASSVTQIPASLDPFGQVSSDNCQTFLFNDVGFDFENMQDFLWDGAEPVRIPFQAAGLKGDDTLIGVTTHPDAPSHLTFVYQHEGQTQSHAWEAPQTVSTDIRLLFWDHPSVFWRVSQFEGLYVVRWNLETNEVTEFPINARLNDGYYRDEAGQRAAWIDFPEPSVIRLLTWHNQQLSEHTLTYATTPTAIRQSHLHWMNDGSLILSLRQQNLNSNALLTTVLYRWDGSTLQPFATLPEHVIPTSDWMVWE